MNRKKRVLSLAALLVAMGCIEQPIGVAYPEDGPAYDDEVDGGAYDEEDDLDLGRTDSALEIHVVATPGQRKAVGTGRNSMTQEFRNQCLKGELAAPVPGDSSGSFDHTVSESRLNESLSFTAEAKGSYGAFSGSAKSKFTRSAQSSETSITTMWQQTIHLDTVGLDYAKPTRWLIPPTSSSFRTSCGDTFVQDVERGAELYILTKMEFATAQEKTAFEASVDASYGVGNIASAKMQLQKARESFSGRAVVHMEAYQRGGDVERLAHAFNGKSEQTDKEGNVTVSGLSAIECKFDNLGPCFDFLNHAIAYATNEFPANARRNPAEIGYVTKDWSVFPDANIAAQAVPNGVKEGRRSLHGWLKNHIECANRIEVLQNNGYLGGDAEFRDLVDQYAQSLVRNEQILKDAEAKCYDNMPANPDNAAISACLKSTNYDILVRQGFAIFDAQSLQTKLRTQNVAGRKDFVTSVTPGVGSWGEWSDWKMCKAGTFATGYSMRVESGQRDGDDSALNAVRLECQAMEGGPTQIIEPHPGLEGTWHPYARCVNGPINGMALRLEGSRGGGDDTAANDLKATCVSGDSAYAAGGMGWGDWGATQRCTPGTAVCGVKVRVERNQGSGDDTAMNGIELACCAY